MKHSEIIRTFDEIKGLLKKGKTDLAIKKTEHFISNLNDRTLEDQIISLSSRYNRLNREKAHGIINDESNKEINSIEANLMNLLRDAKQVAIEIASLEVGSHLSELAQEGSSAIDELRKLNIVIAESRLIELQIFKSMFGIFLASSNLEKINQNIDILKKVLKKDDDENHSSEDSTSDHFLKKLTQEFEKNIPQYEPSAEDIENILYKIKNKFDIKSKE